MYNYKTENDLYKILAKTNKVRKAQNIWNHAIVQRYADDNFYAFTRGDVLACFTNINSLQRTITFHEFPEGTTLCNVLADGDCVTVSGKVININMGEYPKIYVKQ